MGGAQHDALSHTLMGNDRLPDRHMVGHTYGSAGQRGERGQQGGRGLRGLGLRPRSKLRLSGFGFLKTGGKHQQSKG